MYCWIDIGNPNPSMVSIRKFVNGVNRIVRMAKLKSEIELQCPCCHALLVVDTNLGRIVSHREPERGDKPELNEATRILAEEAARRDALFEQSVEAEKTRGDALSRRFEEALRQAKEEPVTRPT